MRVQAVELGRHGDPHIVEYTGTVDGCEVETLLYVAVPRRVSVRELDSQLKTLGAQWLRAAQLIVLRLHPPTAAELLADRAALRLLRRRVEDLPVMVAHLTADRSIRLTPAVVPDDIGLPAHEPD